MANEEVLEHKYVEIVPLKTPVTEFVGNGCKNYNTLYLLIGLCKGKLLHILMLEVIMGHYHMLVTVTHNNSGNPHVHKDFHLHERIFYLTPLWLFCYTM
jgi:hypothetical protein